MRPATPSHAGPAALFLLAAGSAPPAVAPAGGYSGRKLACRQIGSFARAQELPKQGNTNLDRNGDGVACESLRCACPAGGNLQQHLHPGPPDVAPDDDLVDLLLALVALGPLHCAYQAIPSY